MQYHPFRALRASFFDDGFDGALIVAETALDALVRIDNVQFFSFALDAGDGAVARTQPAADTFVRDEVVRERFANARGASFLFDVRLIFVAERLERGENRVCGSLSESTERSEFRCPCQSFESRNTRLVASAFRDVNQDFEHALCSLTTRCAFAT